MNHHPITMRRFACSSSLLLSLLLVLRVCQLSHALIEADGRCALDAFVPFSLAGRHGTSTSFAENKTNNLGFSHMAAAVLAMEHFNARDTSVVPELSQYENCSVTFDLSNRTRFFDTGIVTHQSTTSLMQNILDNNGTFPCAIAGPYFDLPAQLLSVFAASVSIPLVAHRTHNLRITNPFFSPFSNSVYPDQIALAEVLVSFLKHTQRNNYTAILYGIRDTSIQRHAVVSLTLEGAGFKYNSYPYSYGLDEQCEQDIDPTLQLSNAFRQMKADGYRTIVSLLEFSEVELYLLAHAAEEAGMNGDEYFWIFLGVNLSALSYPPIELNSTTLRLLSGGAILSPLEGFQTDPDDRFAVAWKSQDASFVDRVNSFHSIDEGTPGFYRADGDYFQSIRPESGAGSMYDAVMAIGMGACWADGVAEGLSGEMHLRGIRSVDFTGATGRVKLGNGCDAPGGRNASFIKFGVVNLFHLFALEDESNWDNMTQGVTYPALYQITATLDSNGGSLSTAAWTELEPFVYRSGSLDPPKLLRTTPDQNYLSPAVRAVGLSLMSLALFASVSASIWVFFRKKHTVVRKTQPFALHLICFGSFVSSWSIFPLSFDESYGWSEEQLDRGCMSVAWLVSIGHIITYGALFAKLWRLNRVLQFRRTVVPVSHVAWPAALLCVLAISLLTAMTIVAPLEWERVEINAATGESIATCNSDLFGAFILPLAFVMLVPTVLTGIMAWKTQDVDASFSDAFWVGVLIVVQIEVIVLGIPLVYILRDVNTDGRYIGIVMILWTFPASAVALIIVPKVIAYRLAIHGGDRRNSRGTVGTGTVVVSGLPGNSSSSANQRNPINLDDEAIISDNNVNDLEKT